MTNEPNINHLITLFKDAHWRSLDHICSHRLEAEDIEDLAEDLLIGFSSKTSTSVFV